MMSDKYYLDHGMIAECEYLRQWDDGRVDVRFKCYGNGYEEVKTYKSMAAAKGQVTRFLDRCARVYG